MTDSPSGSGSSAPAGSSRAEHVPRFRAIDGVELVGVANRSEESSRRAADELGLERAYPSWQALVADPELDAVLVGAWPILHAPVTIAALEAGKHVLTEARMAATAEDARAMLRAARAHPDQVATVVPATLLRLGGRARSSACCATARSGASATSRSPGTSSGPGDPGDFWRWQRVDERREHHGPRHPGRVDDPLARPARGGHRRDPSRPRGATRAGRPDRGRRPRPRPGARRVPGRRDRGRRDVRPDQRHRIRPRDVPRHDRQPRRRPRGAADRARPRDRRARPSPSATRTAPAGPRRSTSSAPSAADRPAR